MPTKPKIAGLSGSMAKTRRPIPPHRVAQGASASTAMLCPECGNGTMVVDTRPRNGGVARRRACPACNLRFHTFEKIGPTDNSPALLRRVAADLRETAERIERYLQEEKGDAEA